MSAQTVADVLEAAADLLTPEGAWTQQSYGRSVDGEPLFEGYDPAAVCWCAYGAIEKVTGQGMNGALRKSAVEALDWSPFWNDAPERTQAEVVAKLREAAQRARARKGTPS